MASDPFYYSPVIGCRRLSHSTGQRKPKKRLDANFLLPTDREEAFMDLILQIWFDFINELKSQGLRDLFELSPFLLWSTILIIPLKMIAPDDQITCLSYVWFMMAAGIFLMFGSRLIASHLHEMYSFEKFVLAGIGFSAMAAFRFRNRKNVYVLVRTRSMKDGHNHNNKNN